MYVKEMQRVMHGDEDTRVHWAMTDTVTTRFDEVLIYIRTSLNQSEPF